MPKQTGKQIAKQILIVIREYLPDLESRLNALPDPRKRKQYSLAEIIMAGIAMFLFKEKSRNEFNQARRQETFIKNYERLFRLQMPHMDAVEDVMRKLQSEELEILKTHFICQLIEKKVFRRFKLLGKHYLVAVDATGINHFTYKHCEHCLHKTSSKTGKVSYFHQVLEAKLVTSNGMAISLCSEWIANHHVEEFDKQDCEHKAFKRLAVRLKKFFPRLPICILADGLYPNQHFFAICKKQEWKFIACLQDGNLPSLQEEIGLLLPLNASQKIEVIKTDKTQTIHQIYRWLNHLEHQNHALHWVECEETVTSNLKGKSKKTRFVHVTNIDVDRTNVCEISASARLRWKIENQGFNTQKNQGYNLEHKFSRVSFEAMKNYYQCLQLAHLINQFVEKSTVLESMRSQKYSLSFLWEKILLLFLLGTLMDINEVNLWHIGHFQIRMCG